jgi:hypothetical protein
MRVFFQRDKQQQENMLNISSILPGVHIFEVGADSCQVEQRQKKKGPPTGILAKHLSNTYLHVQPMQVQKQQRIFAGVAVGVDRVPGLDIGEPHLFALCFAHVRQPFRLGSIALVVGVLGQRQATASPQCAAVCFRPQRRSFFPDVILCVEDGFDFGLDHFLAQPQGLSVVGF